MNIFVLDNCPAKCAQYHCDRHVIKMILESAQMLCTTLNKFQGNSPYKPTHQNHPCTLWVGESVENWNWLIQLAMELNTEYMFRYEATVPHASIKIIKSLSPPNLPIKKMTPFAQAMPHRYKDLNNPINAYRRFYVAEKRGFCTWTKRQKPDWFIEIENEMFK